MKTARRPSRRPPPRAPRRRAVARPASVARADTETRERLLDASGAVFAARGFRDATVREICAKAGANLAAVNYHFGDKATLYRELMLAHCSRAKSRLEPLRKLTDTPEFALRAFVLGMMQSMLDAGKPAWHTTLMAREMVEPTSVLDDVVEAMIRPVWTLLREIVVGVVSREATPRGSGASTPLSKPRIDLATNSIIAQMLFYKHNRAVIERMEPGMKYTHETIALLAEHVAEFSIAALRGTSPIGTSPLGASPIGGQCDPRTGRAKRSGDSVRAPEGRGTSGPRLTERTP